MSLPNLWNRVLRGRASSRRRQQTHRQPTRLWRSFVPRLEPLEDRTVLSTLTVTNPADSGDGSLRAVIALAQSGDQVVFDTGLKGQTISLTSGPLHSRIGGWWHLMTTSRAQSSGSICTTREQRSSRHRIILCDSTNSSPRPSEIAARLQLTVAKSYNPMSFLLDPLAD